MARTLLLSPPSVSAHPEALEAVLEAHDRNATDIQMLDRLALGLVSLPPTTYDRILVLSDPEQAPTTIDRRSMSKITVSLKPGGRLERQHGDFGEQIEAILAGLVADGQAMVKPMSSATVSLGRKANAAAVPLNAVEAANKRPAGVEFDDFPTREELLAGDTIDPDTLLTEEDRQKPIILPEACKPNGKRRRACKDCSCGLKERLEYEDAETRAAADKGLQTLKLASDDLNEVDFTVKGKVGSCGNCALGDAFRCDGCPYIGLPAFKPGEEVTLLNNEVQL